MTRTELLDKLLAKVGESWDGDTEAAHQDADRCLLEYIDDPAISAAFHEIHKWYA